VGSRTAAAKTPTRKPTVRKARAFRKQTSVELTDLEIADRIWAWSQRYETVGTKVSFPQSLDDRRAKLEMSNRLGAAGLQAAQRRRSARLPISSTSLTI